MIWPASVSSRAVLHCHDVHHPGWTLPPLKIAVLSDLHACAPWTTLSRLRGLVARVNASLPDLIVLGGDYLADRNVPARRYTAEQILTPLMALRATCGVWSIMGNHDWWDCTVSRRTDFRENSVIAAHHRLGLPLLRNESRRISHGDGHFWLMGLDSRMALKPVRKPGFDDYAAALSGISDDAPALLLAHEPDIFAEGHARALLQISGHTHGGQIRPFGRRLVVPSEHGDRYAWGHVQETGRHLVVSGGIGYSGLPLRWRQPPEITLITLTSSTKVESA